MLFSTPYLCFKHSCLKVNPHLLTELWAPTFQFLSFHCGQELVLNWLLVALLFLVRTTYQQLRISPVLQGQRFPWEGNSPVTTPLFSLGVGCGRLKLHCNYSRRTPALGSQHLVKWNFQDQDSREMGETSKKKKTRRIHHPQFRNRRQFKCIHHPSLPQSQGELPSEEPGSISPKGLHPRPIGHKNTQGPSGNWIWKVLSEMVKGKSSRFLHWTIWDVIHTCCLSSD